MTFSPYPAVNAGLLARARPDYVVAPLFSDRFDSLDLARRLSDIGFQGGFVVVCDPLPNRRLVMEELQQGAPGLRPSIIECRPKGVVWFRED